MVDNQEKVVRAFKRFPIMSQSIILLVSGIKKRELVPILESLEESEIIQRWVSRPSDGGRFVEVFSAVEYHNCSLRDILETRK